jgi:hypothetical protein
LCRPNSNRSERKEGTRDEAHRRILNKEKRTTVFSMRNALMMPPSFELKKSDLLRLSSSVLSLRENLSLCTLDKTLTPIIIVDPSKNVKRKM